MSRPSASPPLAVRLLSLCLPAYARDSIIGDLEEEHRTQDAGTFWFWKQTTDIVARYAWRRFIAALIGKPNTAWQAPVQERQGDGRMEKIWNDLRYGARLLLKTPLFTAVSVLTLALGLGANTAIFSIVNSLLIQTLPIPNAQRLVSIMGLDSNGRRQFISYPDYQDMTAAQLFDGFSVFVPQSVNLTGRTEPQRVRGGFVSDTFFELIGVRPAVGRGFTKDVDDREGADRVCLVQHETWKNVFGGQADFLGTAIFLNNEPFTVIGIMPEGFRFPFDEIEVWIPHHHVPFFRNALQDGSVHLRSAGLLAPLGAIKEGVEFEQARSELTGIFQRLSSEHPEGGRNRSVEVKTLQETVVGDVRQMVLVLFGAVVFVLLIACGNVANLMLSRAAARQRELATRAALGAGRGRLMTQLLAENFLLWAAGCAGGLLVGWWGLQLMISASPEELPGGIVARLDLTVFAFSLGLTAATALLFGLIPAIRFSSPNVLDALKEGGTTGAVHSHRTRLRAALVVGQVAMTLMLLVGSGLMLRSFQRLANVQVGFKPANLLTMEYRLPQNKYPEESQQWQIHKQIIERIRELPGVQSASLIRGLPFSGNGGTTTFEVVGRSSGEEKPRARINTADTTYFQTMGIPVLRGRVFNEQDREGSPRVAVINRHMAENWWPNQNPVGQKIRIPDDDQQIDAEIIGVVGDTKQFGLDDPEIGYIYWAQAQNLHIFNTLAVRTAGDPMQMANAVRAAVWSVDRDQPVWKIRTQQSLIDRSLGPPKFLAQLMGCYAGLALLLAAVGIYGVMSLSVTQRTYEIGVRMALGAQGQDVLRMVLLRGLLLTGLGLAIGLAGALALGRIVQSLLYHTSAADPATLASVAVLLAVIAMLASYLPARRAMRVDPLASLRYE